MTERKGGLCRASRLKQKREIIRAGTRNAGITWHSDRDPWGSACFFFFSRVKNLQPTLTLFNLGIFFQWGTGFISTKICKIHLNWRSKSTCTLHSWWVHLTGSICRGKWENKTLTTAESYLIVCWVISVLIASPRHQRALFISLSWATGK